MIITKEDVRNKLPGAVNHQPGLGHLQLFFGASPVDNGKACLVPAMVLSPRYWLGSAACSAMAAHKGVQPQLCIFSPHTGYLAPKVHATHGLQRWSHGLELVGWGPEVHLDLPITPLGPRANQLHLPLPWVSSLINWENYSRFFSKVPSHIPLTVCNYNENSS